jgi:hypothetical protein
MPASKIHIFNAAKKTIPAGKTGEFPMKNQVFFQNLRTSTTG